MKIKLFITFAMLVSTVFSAVAQTEPRVDPTATFVDPNGEETSGSYSGSAPVEASFTANPIDNEGWTSYFEWRFYKESEEDPYLTRNEENTTFTFKTSGSHKVILYSLFTQGTNTVETTSDPFTISLSESKLEMPNAFTPNGDGRNDIYKAKEGYQSIVEFHAYIFNRWGQKLYEWNDPAGGWDGKFNGKDVKQGVYFVLVKAKGADGRKFNIRRDVNLLRGYTESTEKTGGDY